MLIFAAHLPKKRARLLAGICILGLLAGLAAWLLPRDGRGEPAADLTSNEGRLAYLQDLGWAVRPEPLETLQLLLPEELTGAYAVYNELQQSQGFDLSDCCGRQVSRYTYAVSNYPGYPEGVQLNLYVCGGAAVAGDVIAAGADGFQGTLCYPKDS